MSKLTEELRTVGVFNSHGFYNGQEPRGQVFIGYRTEDGRSPFSSRWLVYRIGFKTDPGAHWSDNGNRSFIPHGRHSRKEALAEAQAWAGKRYGIGEWKRDPFGSYGDAEFVTARTAELKAATK